MITYYHNIFGYGFKRYKWVGILTSILVITTHCAWPLESRPPDINGIILPVFTKHFIVVMASVIIVFTTLYKHIK